MKAKGILVFTLLTLITATILFINFFPHYYGYKKTPPNYSYSGQASWFDPQDINNYFATIKSSQQSRHLFLQNPNTTTTTQPTLVYPLYTLTGVLFPQANHILLYHYLSLICAILLALTIYYLTLLVTKNHNLSLLSLLLTTLGAGFGYILPSLVGISADLSIPGVTSLSNFQKPHEGLATLLYSSSLIFFFLATTQHKKRFLTFSITTLLLLIPIYPYRILSFFLITSLFTLITHASLLNLGVIVATVLPPTTLYIHHFLSSSFSVLTSFKPPHIPTISIVLGYGIFLILYPLHFFLKQKTRPFQVFLNIWILVSLTLSIFPWGMGRLFLNGLLFPLVLTFVTHLKPISARLKNPPVFIATIVIFLSLPSSIYIFSKRINEVKNNNPWFYLSPSTQQALDFLKNAKPGGVLTLDSTLTSLIPAHTGQHVYFGIKDQTPNYFDKLNQAASFYQGQLTNTQAQSFLTQNNLNYIITQKEPAPYPFLTPIFHTPNLQILSPLTKVSPL